MSSSATEIDITYASDLHLIKSVFDDDSYWEGILQAKLDFFNFGVDPHTSTYVRSEIADSWMASLKAGLVPDQPVLGEYVSKDQLARALKDNARMIEETSARMQSIDSLNMENDYVLELIDKNGVSLIQVGDLALHQFVGESYFISEGNAGTNAHTLSMRHKRPFVVIGPEHYCFALQGLIACSAPIIDQYDTAIGALLLTQPIPAAFTPADKKLLIHAMSLLSSLASSVSAQLRIKEYNAALSTIEAEYSRANLDAQRYEGLTRNLIETIKEGTIVLDSDFVIQDANPEASHALMTTPEHLAGRSFCSIFDLENVELARSFFQNGKPGNLMLNGRNYLATPKCIYPEDGSDEPVGFILLLKEIPTVTLGARKRAGDVALVTFDGILGKSPQVQKAKELARRFARSDENVLITGESGTGKELFAQAIHNASCPDGPFMSINCAAIPPRLIESELFGYEAGSFTGADRSGKPGKIELADGGTLFLDEIGDMPLELQATLLRVLENKRVMRIGGKSYKQVNFRLISATNRNLAEISDAGQFREDLLYRLSVLTVTLPPLRERVGDVLFFANYFLVECQIKTDNGKARLSPEAEAFITAYRWPGNVRQLKHAVYSAYYTCENGLIELDDFPAYLRQGIESATAGPLPSQNESYASINVPTHVDQYGIESHPSQTEAPAPCPSFALPTLSLQELETIAINQALEQTDGNVIEAAKILGISKATLYRKLKSRETPPQPH